MYDVFIGIGSNLGNREDNCNNAIQQISKVGIEIIARSSMYETEPWGITDQPKFINMVVRVGTDMEPSELLEVLKAIEKKMGRQDSPGWGPRLIDLDILLYGDLVIDEPDLKVPHPHMFERDFVLKPLSEIAPEIIKKYTK
ncbi:MAG: 2-amino-4-hydroxy-6-hydroxymethyldihydropteridine diphosphokinase [Thermodesulfovibrionales bacterium]